MKKYLAEMVGTMVLVFMGCGAAVSLGCAPIGNQAAVVGATAKTNGATNKFAGLALGLHSLHGHIREPRSLHWSSPVPGRFGLGQPLDLHRWSVGGRRTGCAGVENH